jgi:short-subunit dehydrogenase
MSSALVTGATAGLGREYAEQLARAGYDLVLVARDADRLARTAADLEHRFGGTVEVLAADLADRTRLALVEARLADLQRPVDLLVNNAGFSTNQRFVGGDLELEARALDVMVTAVLRLSHAALGPMVERGHGAVINVSSVSAWVPSGTYSGAKAYVVSFTEGLAAQLRGTGVRAMVVCPGFVHTEFHDRAGIDMRLPEPMWLDAGQVVRESLRDLERGRVLSVPSARYKGVATLVRHVPPRLASWGYSRVRRPRSRAGV